MMFSKSFTLFFVGQTTILFLIKFVECFEAGGAGLCGFEQQPYQDRWTGSLPVDRRRRKSPLDGAVDFLSKIQHHFTTVSFASALFFVVIRNASDASKCVKMWCQNNFDLF